MKNKITLISSVCVGGYNDTLMYDTVIKYQDKTEHIEIDKFWDNGKEKDLWRIESNLKLSYEMKKSIISILAKDMPSIYSNREPKKYNIDIISEDEIKSLKGWHESDKEFLTDYLHIGDKVDKSLIDELIGSLPPITLNGEIVQIGGEYSCNDKGKNTYITFAKETPFGDWYYMGACIKDETINREYKFEEFEIDLVNEIEEEI